jgi:integrase
MKPEPLTSISIRNLKPPPTGRRDIADGATPGLCLRVSAHDTWKWTLRMRGPEGGLRRFVLGDFTDAQGLAWARRQAEKTRQQVRHEGHDPHRERKARVAAAAAEAQRERLTLKVLVEDWERRRLSNRRPRYAAEALRALRVAFEKQWGKPAEDLGRVDIAQVLSGLIRTKTKGGETVNSGYAIASRTAAYGRACFSWAIKHHLVQSNPFDRVPIDDFQTEPRDRVLTDDELVAVWRAAEATKGPFGRLIQFLVLTGQRREEVSGLSWPELSEDRLTWTIPRSRAKNGKAHLVPLSEMAQLLLPVMPPDADRRTELVFLGRRKTPFSGWSKCKAQLDQDSGVTNRRIHDLRRTLATGLQRLGTRLEVTEAVLNHVSGSRAGIVGIYQRHDWADEKRAALNAWAEHLRSLIDRAREVAKLNPHGRGPEAAEGRRDSSRQTIDFTVT